MPRAQAIGLIIVALAVGFVLGLKSGQGRAPAAAGTPAAPSVGLPRLVDLGSTTCIPCKQMAPILEELKAEYAGKVDVEFINVNEDAEAASRYGIMVIPTQIFFDSAGEEVYRHEGFMPKADIVKQFTKIGVPVE